jgi:hypothetical protein
VSVRNECFKAKISKHQIRSTKQKFEARNSKHETNLNDKNSKQKSSEKVNIVEANKRKITKIMF